MVLQHRVALVTGASRGIGHAIALGFAREGADLILCSRHETEVKPLAGEVERMGRRALALRADVSSESDIQGLVERGIAHFGRIDIVHNNAAILKKYPLTAHPLDAWEETMAINIRGTFLCCKTVLPYMVKQGYGRLINMTSILSVLCVPTYGSYNVSKAAINALTKTLAQEFAGQNILINGQHPGNIKTEMNPAGTHPVEHAVPTAIYLASLPDGGPSGHFFYDMKEMGLMPDTR